MCCYLVTAGAKVHIFIGVSIARGHCICNN